MKFLIASFVAVAMFTLLLAGCQPISQNGGGGSSSGGPVGGETGAPTLTQDERQILGKYSNSSGKSLEFFATKRGNISSDANQNTRAAFSEITNGAFSWSATGKQITLVIDNGGNFTATFNPDNYSIEIENEKFRLEGAPEELPPEVLEEIQNSASGDPTISGEINLEKRNVISRLVIVSAPDFSETTILKKYINHKTTQGFSVTHLKSSGETADSIKQQLKQIYDNDVNKQMAVLLVGDMTYNSSSTSSNEDIPAFYSTIGKYTHPTDFHYGDLNDDWVQEVMVGRFSVLNENELSAQVNKIIQMENGVNGTLDSRTQRIVRTSGVYGEGSQCIDEYLTSIGRGADLFSDKPGTYGLFDEINAGSGLLIYSGHGMSTSWAGVIDSSRAATLTNSNVYPVAIGSTCLSGSYHHANSLGEAFINNQNGGAVAYIGASAISYEHCNQAMVSGNWRGIKKFSPGMIGSLYHDISQSDINYRVRTVGGVLQAGYRALRYYFNDKIATSEMGKYSTEIYNLLGDPTYMPYTESPKEIMFSYGKAQAGRNFVVNTGAAYSQVALSRKDEAGNVVLIAAAMSDSDGKAVLNIPAESNAGTVTLYAIAQNYVGKKVEIQMADSTGATKNNIATLKSITVAGTKITVASGIDTYNATVAYENYPIKVSLETTDMAAVATGVGDYYFNVGTHDINISVTAEDGVTTKNYMLKVTRKDSALSRDYKIKTLKIDNVVVHPRDSSEWYYDYTLNGKTQLTVEVEMNNINAKCWIQGVNDVDDNNRKAAAKNILKEVVNINASGLTSFGDFIPICTMSEFEAAKGNGEWKSFTVKFQ